MFTSSKFALYLTGILLLFLFKGVFLAVLFPLFQNPDEQTHYSTAQYWAEPQVKNWPFRNLPSTSTTHSSISTYGFSEEVIRSAEANQFDEVRASDQNIPDFTTILSDQALVENDWKRYIDTTSTNVSGTRSVYYLLGSWLERLLSSESIFARLFSMRTLATLFGAGVIYLAYHIARRAGFSPFVGLLFTILVAFQPMFAMTAAQVNIDIALVFAFSLFLFAGVSLLRDGLTWSHALLLISAAILGLFSKGPGIVLVAMLYPLLAWTSYRALNLPLKKFLTLLAGASIFLASTTFLIIPKSYFVNITNFTAQSKFSSTIESIGKYLDKTLSSGELRDTARSYWGHFGWLDNAIPDWTLSVIILITIVGFIGTVWYLCSQRKFTYLPEKRFLVLFLGMIIALQIAIRFYDWRVFDYTGQILIGQPGRYFLPNVIAHLIIIATGIGFLLRREKFFLFALKALTLAMILLQIHAIINVIIPRYYL
ncbi:MAG: phospholipid carrier-dependent glycosyltransferase [Candidatus Moraniibacteriota bacterium]|nr:MAG: phospholipid carrier-dependent glycosyltransferase [Candidatus Moranbacteria bacterium]